MISAPFGYETALTIRPGDRVMYRGHSYAVEHVTATGDMAPYFWLDGIREGISYLLCEVWINFSGNPSR